MELLNEVFANIHGYPNYQISNIGNVKNVKTGKILKTTKKSTGYLVVAIYNDDGMTQVYIHRLIGKNFIPNPNNLQFIDHIDGNRLNNSITNLRWASNSQNQSNAKKTTKKTSSIYKGVYKCKITNNWRAQIRKDGKLQNLGCFDDEKEAARTYNNKAAELFGSFAKLNVISDDE